MASSRGGSSLWVGAWLRAVALPGWRRAAAVWASLAIIASIVMGPTGLLPSTVVNLLVHSGAAAALLAGLWLALFHPVAKLVVRAEAASFLRSLPAPAVAPLLPALTLAAMELPPLVLFVAGGEPGLGAAVWAGCCALSYAMASVQVPGRAPRALRWRTPGQALRAVLASRLLVDDALLRGVAFAGIAGAGAGLMIRNNQLIGAAASTLGLGTVIVLGTPAWAAILQPLAVVHRRIWPTCASSGMPAATWVGSLAAVLAGALAGLCSVAGLLASRVAAASAADTLRMVGGAAALGAGIGLGAVRVSEWATRAKMVAERVLTGTLLIAAIAALALGLFGELGIVAVVTIAAVALVKTPEPVLW
jgi:hypothetical protein